MTAAPRPRAPGGGRRGRVVSESEFRRLWADKGLSLQEIGAQLGISQQAVSCRAKARGLPPRGKNYQRLCAIPPSREAELRALWEAGVGSRDICSHFGVCHTSLGVAVRLFGLPRRGSGWRPRITLEDWRAGASVSPRASGRCLYRDPERVRTLWEAGLSYADIGRLIGVSRSGAQAYCHRRGWRRELASMPRLTLEQWRDEQLAARFADVAARETAIERDRRLGIRRAA